MNIITSAFLAARPKTLTASLIPVWAGCMVVQKLTGSWNASLALLTLTSCPVSYTHLTLPTKRIV